MLGQLGNRFWGVASQERHNSTWLLKTLPPGSGSTAGEYASEAERRDCSAVLDPKSVLVWNFPGFLGATSFPSFFAWPALLVPYPMAILHFTVPIFVNI